MTFFCSANPLTYLPLPYARAAIRSAACAVAARLAVQIRHP